MSVHAPLGAELSSFPVVLCKANVICRWFHFRLTGVQNTPLVVNLVNAGQSSFPEAWPGYRACASYDLKDWFRVNTTWDEKAGNIRLEHFSNHVSFNHDTKLG